MQTMNLFDAEKHSRIEHETDWGKDRGNDRLRNNASHSSSLKSAFNALHQEALMAAQAFKTSERRLQEILRKIAEAKAYYHLGYRSLYDYATQALGLTPDVAYNHCAVVKKTEALPEVRKALDAGMLTVSKVRHMAPVLNPQNQKEMIRLGSELSQPELRREIARLNPELEEKPEKARYVRENRVALELRVSEQLMKKLRRAQDLVSQGERKLVSLEETLEAVMEVYLQKVDPLEKAKRATARNERSGGLTLSLGKSLKEDGADPVGTENGPGPKMFLKALQADQAEKAGAESTTTPRASFRMIRKKDSNTLKAKRTPIPAVERHQVLLREKSRCAHHDTNGKRCAQTRFLHFHHIKPVSLGGSNRAENLTLLCSGITEWFTSGIGTGSLLDEVRLVENNHWIS